MIIKTKHKAVERGQERKVYSDKNKQIQLNFMYFQNIEMKLLLNWQEKKKSASIFTLNPLFYKYEIAANGL